MNSKTIILNIFLIIILATKVYAIGILIPAQSDFTMETKTIHIPSGTMRNFTIGFQNGNNVSETILVVLGGTSNTSFLDGTTNKTIILNPFQYDKFETLKIYQPDNLNRSLIIRITSIVQNTNDTISTSAGTSVSFTIEGKCSPNWSCSNWTKCDAGIQTRTCVDINKCNDSSNKPSTSKICSNSSNSKSSLPQIEGGNTTSTSPTPTPLALKFPNQSQPQSQPQQPQLQTIPTPTTSNTTSNTSIITNNQNIPLKTLIIGSIIGLFFIIFLISLIIHFVKNRKPVEMSSDATIINTDEKGAT